MFENEKNSLEKQILAFFEAEGIARAEEIVWSQIPFSGEWGLSTSMFKIAAEEARQGKTKDKVPDRATEIAEKLAAALGTPKGFARVEAVKGYLNLYFAAPEFAYQIVSQVLAHKTNYGRGEKKGKRYMVEFSQPNTHKAFHVGHLRNLILGAAIANILDFAGYDVVRANYIGDFGKDVMKWIWNYRQRHSGEKPPDKDVTRWMGDLYAEASKKLEEDPDAEDQVRELFSRWEAEDPEIHNQWLETRQWSLDGFSEIYETMGVSFDRIYYESEVEKPGKEMVAQLIDAGIANDERAEGGPVIVKVDEQLGLAEEKYRVLVLLRSDGSSLYGAWDLALALMKFHEYELDKSIYIVDVRQSLHFQQVFKTLELAGYKDQMKKVYHLPYEIVNLPGNLTMSSREGIVVLLEDFIREAISRSEAVILEKNPDLDTTSRTAAAEAIGLGSMKFPLLARENTKIAVFNWEEALDLTGQAAPYIQYAFVRANSILTRYGQEPPIVEVPGHELESSEIELIDRISQLPNTVQRAAAEYKTLHITNYTYELARAFNEFYNQSPVLQAEKDVRAFRLNLVAAAQSAIAIGLDLLGITPPNVM
ncbi:MAG: arginine--tRNA ligase [Chloroflexi bacterium]|nr:arginine--tRNA ligase [Chloroflexota bacterium]